MNDILHDIKKLKEVKKLCYGHKRNVIVAKIQEMISEKENQILDFEKTAPSHIQELCQKIRG